jgi:hypothetical protein
MYVAEFIPSGLLVVLLGLLVRRRIYAALPYFFAYAAFAVVADVARFAVHNHHDCYYVIYWATEAGYDVLGMLVMYEVLHTVLGSKTSANRSLLIFAAVFLQESA